jgi:hypothetical protein
MQRYVRQSRSDLEILVETGDIMFFRGNLGSLSRARLRRLGGYRILICFPAQNLANPFLNILALRISWWPELKKMPLLAGGGGSDKYNVTWALLRLPNLAQTLWRPVNPTHWFGPGVRLGLGAAASFAEGIQRTRSLTI